MRLALEREYSSPYEHCIHFEGSSSSFFFFFFFFFMVSSLLSLHAFISSNGSFHPFPSPSTSQFSTTSLSVFGSPCPRIIPSTRVLADLRSPSSPSQRANTRPSPAEAARTLVQMCSDGTLCTLTKEGWPLCTAVRFAVDLEGNPICCFHTRSIQAHQIEADNRCSLHVQMEQPGHRKPQCTLKGRLLKSRWEQKLRIAWDSRFTECNMEEEHFYVMNVEEVLHNRDVRELEGVWVSGSKYKLVSPDPLRECATMIVDDMNKKHWEDIQRFCKVYGNLDLQVEQAHMTWVDRLGFDMQILTLSPQEIREIRIPFSREVNDERDARSSLTMMAQLAWEYERNYSPEIQVVGG